MVEPSLFLGFLLVAALAYVVPGPDWFVVLGSAARDRRAGLASGLGALSGLVVHTAAAAVGVSAILVASAEAFAVVKWLGAAYLVFLGVRGLLSARRTWRGPDVVDEAGGRGDTTARRAWASAFTTNVLNPKAALFFVAVLPQFLDPTAPIAPQIVLLGAADIALGAVWWVAFVLAVSHFREFLRRRRARAALDAGSGLALIGLGGALALASRRTA